MKTLLDLLPDMRRLSDCEAVRFHTGLRTIKLTYKELLAGIGGFIDFLDERGIRKGDRLLIWGENRPEWLIAFWGCLASGVAVVPIDFRSSDRLVRRIQDIVGARLLVHGKAVPPLQIEGLSFDQIDGLAEKAEFEVSDVEPDDIAEIVFTSGTTGEPKGVVHRHRNICANLKPFKKEIDRYKKYARPFQPIRFLDMLPLSHMFGQSLGAFIPVLLEGSAVYTSDLRPSAIVRIIRRERISVLVAVPRLLMNLQNELDRRFDLLPTTPQKEGALAFMRRSWRSRSIHAEFGWKFWFVVVGGARVDPEIEEFWSRHGFILVQGYGLTETSPVVSVNHPFKTRRGSLGKALGEQEIRIAPDGEILVRGENVVTEFMGAGEESAKIVENGWLHTGDIGEIDQEGLLYYKGRKKDVIVTSDGLNVHPQDVESALNRLPEVRESVVVGLPTNGEERVHAALILEDEGSNPEKIIQKANRVLEPHQHIRAWSIWPEESFPRTPSTLKLLRREVAGRLLPTASSKPHKEEEEAPGIEGIIARMAGRNASDLKDGHRLVEDLGLSSLERVDLLSALEDRYGLELEEETFAGLSSLGEVKAWLDRSSQGLESSLPESGLPRRGRTIPKGPDKPVRFNLPRWTRSFPFRWSRVTALQCALLPILRWIVDITVEGGENLKKVRPPVIFAANHTSHFDTPTILASLPFEWRWRLAPAMMQAYFQPYFHPEGFPFSARLTSAIKFYIACGLFNAYPLPQEMGRIRRALIYTGELADLGYCPLVFPEGVRSPDGELNPFKPGIGLMGIGLRIPVIPIHIDGLFEVFSIHQKWPRRGRVGVKFGAPVTLEGIGDYKEAARQVEQAVRRLADHRKT